MGLAQGAGSAPPDVVERLSRMAKDWADANAERKETTDTPGS
jgi:hypothetical protein